MNKVSSGTAITTSGGCAVAEKQAPLAPESTSGNRDAQHAHSAQRRGLIGAALAMTCVGSLTAVSATLDRYPVYGGQALRYAVAGLILLAISRYRQASAPQAARQAAGLRDLLLIAALAATGLAAFSVFIVEATKHASPATVGTVVGAVPIALAFAGPLMAGKRPAPRIVTAAVVVTLGATLANGLGGGSLTGLLLALGALAGEVCFSLLAVPLLPKLGAVRVSAYAALAAAPMCLAAGLIWDGAEVVRMPTLGEAAALAYLSLVVTVAAFIVWYGSLARIGADRAGLFAGLIPVSAAATTMILGMGLPSTADLAGAALVAAGVVIGVRSR